MQGLITALNIKVDVKLSIDNNTIMRMKIIHIEYSEMFIQKIWQKSHSYPVTVVY